jgi:uncharacterized protein YwbE
MKPTIAFQLNNVCNMHCTFCYVEGRKTTHEVAFGDIDDLLALGAETYVCIGKEPTLSPTLLAYFIEQATLQGAKTGFITNGVALTDFLTRYPRLHVHAIDITYHKGDRGRWDEDQVQEAAILARSRCDHLSVLFVLHSGSVARLPSAIAFAERVRAEMCVVSPVIHTERVIPYDPSLLYPTLEQFLGMLAQSVEFMDSPITITGIDDFQFLQAQCEPLATSVVEDIARRYGLQDKVVAIGNPFESAEGPAFIDIDLLGEEPVAVHPLYRLNTSQIVRSRFPTVPIRGKTCEAVYEKLLLSMSNFDYRTAVRL